MPSMAQSLDIRSLIENYRSAVRIAMISGGARHDSEIF